MWPSLCSYFEFEEKAAKQFSNEVSQNACSGEVGGWLFFHTALFSRVAGQNSGFEARQNSRF